MTPSFTVVIAGVAMAAIGFGIYADSSALALGVTGACVFVLGIMAVVWEEKNRS